MKPIVTVAVPSYNQGRYLDKTLESIFSQNFPVEVFVMDGGSTDNSIDIIKKWKSKLAGWRSNRDNGQSAAINEGIEQGTAPYVCWLNSDDWFLSDSLNKLVKVLEKNILAPAAYGRAYNFIQKKQKTNNVWVEPFNEKRLALRCIISQPATLIRRSVWQEVNGVDLNLHLAMDYDLWWKIYKNAGPLIFINDYLAVNRIHSLTKTSTKRKLHYQEAMQTVKKYYGAIPLKWWLFQPYSVLLKSLINNLN